MYNKICYVCGKPFQAANPRYNTCSAECRRIRHNAMIKEWRSKTAYKKKYNYYKPIEKLCAYCGDKLPDGRQTYCLKCLVKDYVQDKSFVAYQRLALRGFCKEDIFLEAERLNLL